MHKSYCSYFFVGRNIRTEGDLGSEDHKLKTVLRDVSAAGQSWFDRPPVPSGYEINENDAGEASPIKDESPPNRIASSDQIPSAPKPENKLTKQLEPKEFPSNMMKSGSSVITNDALSGNDEKRSKITVKGQKEEPFPPPLPHGSSFQSGSFEGKRAGNLPRNADDVGDTIFIGEC